MPKPAADAPRIAYVLQCPRCRALVGAVAGEKDHSPYPRCHGCGSLLLGDTLRHRYALTELPAKLSPK